MSGLSDLLIPDMKLEDLESSLAVGGDDQKNRVISAISGAQDSILPMRLQFNDFMQAMSSIDNLQESTPLEKFTMIRSKVLDLTSKLQAISEDVSKLQPLFDTIPEYSEEHGTKKFQPLETLRLPSNNLMSASAVQSNLTPVGNNTNVTTLPNKKSSRSNDGTPVSHASTPSGPVLGAAIPAAAKKPRKPRQTKKAQAAAAAAAASVKSQQATVLSPTPPTHMMNSVASSNPVQMGLSGVPPTNMIGTPMQSLMSPLGSTPSAYGIPRQPSQQQQIPQQQIPQQQIPQQQIPQQQIPQQQQQQQQYNQPSRNNSVPLSQPLNLNNITPANILNMNMNVMADAQQQPQQNAKKEFDPLDFNNLDFGNINMDMI